MYSAGEEYGPDSRCFVSSLNRVEKVSELVPLPGISTQRCYRTACQGPKKLRIMVNGFHYLCPIEGGELSIAGFGGKVTCPPVRYSILSYMCYYQCNFLYHKPAEYGRFYLSKFGC